MLAASALPETSTRRSFAVCTLDPAAEALRKTSRGPIISQDPRIVDVLSVIDRVARSSCTVLVTGESGTG